MRMQLSRRLLIVFGIFIYGFFSCSLCEAWSSSSLDCWRIRSNTVGLLLQSSSSSSHSGSNHSVSDRLDATTGTTAQQKQRLAFQIQKCQYADLNVVSDIIMDSFYDTKTSWRRLLKLAELNRLQQNFPYIDTDLHQMLVAVAARTDEQGVDDDDDAATTPTTTTTARNKSLLLSPRTVIGFVDIDARPCRPEIKLPRPYLSDLAVHPEYRRQGVAQALIQAGEDFCRAIPRKELYIRVEETNHAAVDMYMTKLKYQSRGVVEETKDKKRIITLHKLLVPQTSLETSGNPGTSTTATGSDPGQAIHDDQEFVI